MHQSEQLKLRPAGFSLLEMVIVVAILSVCLAIGFYLSNLSRTRAQLKVTVQTLVSNLASARQMGIGQGGSTVDFSGLPDSYQLKDRNGVVVRTFEAPNGIIIGTPSFGNVLTYNANGSTGAEGSITISGANINTRYRVSITQASGYVEVTESEADSASP